MIGSVLGGYHIIDKIKDGSVGTVYKGRNSFNEDVAIKVLAARYARDSKKLKDFRNEVKIATQFKHPGIIRILKFADVSPQPYIIMEYFRSENLKFALKNTPELLHGKEFKILKQICIALHAMHKQNIVHLDVKPENVLVSDSGEVRLIDFSIAQTNWGRRLRIGKTKWGGTPAYMAPEQIRGEAVSQATDQYALGVLAHELFTRRLPFAAPHQNGLLEKHLTEAPPPLRKHLPKAPVEVELFLLRMLEKNPAKRFTDLTSVVYEIDKLSEKWGVWWTSTSSEVTTRTKSHTARMMQPTQPPRPAPSPAKVPTRGDDLTVRKTSPIPIEAPPKAPALDPEAVAPPAQTPAAVEPAAPPAEPEAKPDEPETMPSGPTVIEAKPRPAPAPPPPPRSPADAEVEALLEQRLKRRLNAERERKSKNTQEGGASKPRAPHESDMNMPAVR